MTKTSDAPEWEQYITTFVRFFVKKHFHVKRQYDDGFIRQKDEFKNIAITDTILEEVVTKHLDIGEWNAAHPDDQEPEFFWLGQFGPESTKLDCIDFDNKENVIGKALLEDDQGRRTPLVTYPSEQFKALKRLHDTFPGRITALKLHAVLSGFGAGIKRRVQVIA